jgi:hypothetical protein
VVGAFSNHDMVVVGVGEASVSCLRGEGRVSPPSLFEAMWNSSVESPVVARDGDGGPQWVEPMAVASELSLQGERFRMLKQSMMNLRLPKQMVSPRDKSSCDEHSPSAVTVIVDEGTIETSRGKARCKSSFLACQL